MDELRPVPNFGYLDFWTRNEVWQLPSVVLTEHFSLNKAQVVRVQDFFWDEDFIMSFMVCF